jgi:hypothetical protein
VPPELDPKSDAYEGMPNEKEYYRKKLAKIAKLKGSKKQKLRKADFLMYKFIFNEIDPDGVGLISKQELVEYILRNQNV